MILNSKTANKIVQKTMSILGKNINIMDQNGRIIASGDLSRVGTFHEGSLLVIQREKQIEISAEDVHCMKGVKPGVNLPVYFENSLIGVVGITGNPEEARQVGQLVKEMVELMIHEFYLSTRLQLENRAREAFIQEVISNRNSEKYSELVDRGNILGINLQIHRISILMDIYKFSGTVSYFREKYNYHKEGELLLQELKDRIMDSISKSREIGSNDIIQYGGRDRFIILKEVQVNVPEAIVKQKAFEFCEQMRQEISEKFSLQTSWGIGRLYTGSDALYQSFQDSLSALNISQKYEHVGEVVHIDDVTIENIVSNIPEKQMEILSSSLTFLANSSRGISQDLMKTLEVFFECNMNVSDTARKLYMHRNTIIYRLNKIKNVIGLNPLSFRDAVQLYLAFLSCQS